MSLKDFQILAKLGDGAYSAVYKVKRIEDGSEYALKKVKLQNLSEKEKQNAINEVRILASIRNQNVVQYKEAFLDESTQSLWQNYNLRLQYLQSIIMELVDQGDLYQKIVDAQKKSQLIPEPEIWETFIQIVNGLKALHDLKILHRDLKSANVFLNKDRTAKLGDMNVSKIAKKGLLYTQTGTPYYASPEVWKDQPYDQKSDIWSLGCVLYEMTSLKPPFRAEDMEGLYKKVIKGYYPKIPSCYSMDLNNVIRALLQVPPHLRPTCDKILQMQTVIKKMDDKLLYEVDEINPSLLQTIKISKNMHYLTERLPKPNYSPLKLKKVEKLKFIQTLGISPQRDETLEVDQNNSDIGLSNLPKVGDQYRKVKSIQKTEHLKPEEKNINQIYGQKKNIKKRQYDVRVRQLQQLDGIQYYITNLYLDQITELLSIKGKKVKDEENKLPSIVMPRQLQKGNEKQKKKKHLLPDIGILHRI